MNYIHVKSRIIAISDIHGELWKLQELFNRLSLQKDDRIIFLGDYIDRGSHSRSVIDYIINLGNRYNVVTLLGNHEAMVLEVMDNRFSGMLRSWIQNGGETTLNCYKNLAEFEEIHGDFLRNLKLIHEEEKYIFVHGYLAHSLDVEEQHKDSCIWGRFDEIKPHKSGKIVVCGHTIQHGGPTDLGYKVCIDTGSFKPDGYITAMVIDGDKVNYVKSN